MRKMLIIGLYLFCLNSNAAEIVCNGYQAKSGQRVVTIDCSNRAQVINALETAWVELVEARIGGATENMCWKPYVRATEIHPSISFDGIAPTFLAQCNMAYQYVK